jgi:hypothetical protein
MHVRVVSCPLIPPSSAKMYCQMQTSDFPIEMLTLPVSFEKFPALPTREFRRQPVEFPRAKPARLARD